MKSLIVGEENLKYGEVRSTYYKTPPLRSLKCSRVEASATVFFFLRHPIIKNVTFLRTSFNTVRKSFGVLRRYELSTQRCTNFFWPVLMMKDPKIIIYQHTLFHITNHQRAAMHSPFVHQCNYHLNTSTLEALSQIVFIWQKNLLGSSLSHSHPLPPLHIFFDPSPHILFLERLHSPIYLFVSSHFIQKILYKNQLRTNCPFFRPLFPEQFLREGGMWTSGQNLSGRFWR